MGIYLTSLTSLFIRLQKYTGVSSPNCNNPMFLDSIEKKILKTKILQDAILCSM